MNDDVEFEVAYVYEEFEAQTAELEDKQVEEGFLRVKSLILLAILLLPTLLIAFEILTGGISGAITPVDKMEPMLPPALPPSVHF